MKINEYFKQKLILLGLRIKQLREERNLTIKDVALKTGIRIQYLQKIEKGLAYGVLIDKHLLKIANALSVKLGELFDFQEK
ncbi:MAG: helix-turn-helix domain-containing protein [Cyanobacteria bacterium SIG28]|nr:helix-turn-helix domain-containing protein [Cyanobacteria bacterium SIG28]